VTRLIDMGVEPFLIASSVEGVLAQRLVRRICKSCGAAYEPDVGDLPKDFNLRQGQTLTRGEGCRECRQTGYRGRLGIYELLTHEPRDPRDDHGPVNAPTIAAHALETGTCPRSGRTGTRRRSTARRRSAR
jgi:type II secretory ATPase GspE/PulE/Tfp pilus assembly ATPase PilB-like protein